MTEDLLPDYKAIRPQAKLDPPDIFILVHYFGMPTPSAEARELCVNTGAWLVEDAAHMLTPLPISSIEGDFILYSPHKVLALPQGALLVARSNGASRLGAEALSRLGTPETWSNQLAGNDTGYSSSSAVWLAKRVLQKLGIRGRVKSMPFEDDPGAAPLPAPRMTFLARRLLARSLGGLQSDARWRWRNLLLLDELVQRLPRRGLNVAWRDRTAGWTPYMAAYRSEDAPAEFDRLRRAGIPATSWPDLAPEVIGAQGHEVANHLRSSHVFLPIHQSLGERHVLAMSPDSPPSKEGDAIDWEEVVDAHAWGTLLSSVEISNLLQSWSYGESKAKAGWKVRRYILSRNGTPLALVQVLSKQFMWFGIHRINRGPLFTQNAHPDVQQACLRSIASRFGRLARGQLLSWAPERHFTGANLLELGEIGFRLRSPQSWSSSAVDLRVDERNLRANLTGSWRNMLTVAEKKDTSVEESSDPHVFERLLLNCEQIMGKRRVPFPSAFYRNLFSQLDRDGNPGLLLVVRKGDELVAGTWVVPHGSSATYLLGWNGDLGRVVNAHHLLLWESMRRLKARGVQKFDLGGIDAERTGGIAAFKLGMGGERYSLVGEGWCC